MENPIIDWKLSVQLAGNNSDYAKEFLTFLAKELSQQLGIIQDHFQKNQIDELKKELHKLLGALSYSGATRLKFATIDFNEALKNNTHTSMASKNFENEAHLFIEHVQHLPQQYHHLI